MDVSILQAELRLLEERRSAIENLLAVYQNGTVEPKVKNIVVKRKPFKRKDGMPTFHDQIIALAKKIAESGNGSVKVKQVLDSATESGLVKGKDRNKELQQVASTLGIETKRGTFERIGTGYYQFKKAE